MSERFQGARVLVSGGSGFIGSHLVRSLSAEGAQVHALSRQADPWRLRGLGPSVTLHRADLCDAQGLRSLVDGLRPEFVFHLAASTLVERDMALLPAMLRTNVEGTANLAAVCGGVRSFVYTGTCEEYGDQEAPFREGSRESPVSPYSLSKAMASHLCLMLHRTRAFPAVVARPFLTYGPGQEGGMFIPALLRACLEGRDFDMTPGEQTREFNFVGDIVEGLLLAALTPAALGEIINLGSGREVTVRETAELIVRLTGSKTVLKLGALPYRAGEAMRFFSSPEKARKILGWTARTSLEEGLSLTLSALRAAAQEKTRAL